MQFIFSHCQREKLKLSPWLLDKLQMISLNVTPPTPNRNPQFLLRTSGSLVLTEAHFHHRTKQHPLGRCDTTIKLGNTFTGYKNKNENKK